MADTFEQLLMFGIPEAERGLVWDQSFARAAELLGYPYPIADADDRLIAGDWLKERGLVI